MPFHVKDEELIEMIKAQEVLNIKYNGVLWRKTVKPGQIKFAILDEVSEFAREISKEWKWWSSNTTFDKNNATFEFIDVIHFALLMCLYRHSDEELCELIKKSFPPIRANMWGRVDDPLNAFSKALTYFFRAFDQDSRVDMLVGIRNLFETGAHLLHLDYGDIVQAYKMKNERNHKRVEGGVMQGVYSKADEVELEL